MASSAPEASGALAWVVRRLTRVTSSGLYIPELDGLRWLAMALVFLQHFQLAILATTADRSVTPDPGLATLYDMRVGVELFFVISGFILGVPFVSERVLGKERVDLRAYFLRRLTRIEPPYFIALAMFTALWLMLGRTPRTVLAHSAASFFYAHNLVYGPFHPQAINMVTWSLEIEVQFYVLAPVLARVFLVHGRRARRSALALSCLASSAAVEVARRFGIEPPLSIVTQVPYFAAGYLLADIYAVDWDRAPRAHWRFDLLAIPTWLAIPLVATAPIPMRDLALAAALFVAFFSSFRSVATRAFLGWTPVRLLGGMCYSVYLMHFVPMGFVWRLLWAGDVLGAQGASGARWLDTLGYGVLTFVLMFPLFLGFYLAVEHPFMRNHWWQRLMPKPRGDSRSEA